MKECHVCHFMCEDSAEICPICGAELTFEAENTETAEMENPVLAVSVDSPVTAEIFTDILSENGILFSVDEKGDFLHTGFGGGFFAVDVYVDEKDLDTAKDIYRNLAESDISFDGEFEDFEESDDETDGEV